VNGLDLVIVGLAVVFALAGLRQGFVVSVVSFAGFLAGALLGLLVVPLALTAVEPGILRTLLALGGVLGCAALVQVLTSLLAGRVKARITWRPARALDAAGGALVSVVAVVMAAWLLGMALARSAVEVPFATLARDSRVLATVDSVLPAAPDQVFSAFGDLLDSTGFPRVFSDLGLEPITPVTAPDPDLLANPEVQRAGGSVVKILGSAPACRRRIEGSGFVYAPGRVMTNAHVVAGVEEPRVYVDGSGRGYRARVVVFDPATDVAVLWVPRLELEPLAFGETVRRGADAVVLGYPGDGALDAAPARVRGTIDAVGEDIYGRTDVTREVLALRATVRAGNSGGPLVGTDGRVVGVVFAASTEDADTGYALSVSAVSAAAAAGRRSGDEVSTGPCA
jgi:S1-C subfamily serine protease